MKKIVSVIVLGLLVLLATAMGVRQAVHTVKAGARAYLFGYPLVLMDVTAESTLGKWRQADVNEFVHVRYFPDASFRNVVRPNNDTLYSTAWLDLEKGPQVITVPDAGERYYVLPLMDAWTNVFARVGTRTTGDGAGHYVVKGPDYEGPLPPEMTSIDSPSNRVWIIMRIQANGRSDFPAVFELQDGFHIADLSRWPDGPPNPSHVRTSPDDRAAAADPSRVVETFSPGEFFNRLSGLMDVYPPAGADQPMLEQLERFGIVPGRAYRPEGLNWIKRRLLALGVSNARERIRSIAKADRANENGWAVMRSGIGRYGTNYGLRALVAKIGLGALPPDEAAYPNAAVDGRGRSLSGSNRYKIHFPKSKLPPVRAFWSLTLYDKRGFLVENPIHRYRIGSADTLEMNPNGSLDIFIQHERPKTGGCNWLPAPEGAFEVTLRLYLPQEAFLNGSWQLPPIERMD